MPQNYPSWRYHRSLPPVVANDPTHELEVAHPEAGWADTPAAFLPTVVEEGIGDDNLIEPNPTWQPPPEMTEGPKTLTKRKR